jgi:hypothetical protein
MKHVHIIWIMTFVTLTVLTSISLFATNRTRSILRFETKTYRHFLEHFEQNNPH